MSAFRSAYRTLGRVGVALGVPGVVLRGRPEERRERLGYAPDGEGRRPLWIHAASVGETVAAEVLIRQLRAEADPPVIALSTMTRTARERAGALGADLGPFHPPLDVPEPVRRALDRLRPRALVVLETELWPVLLEESGRYGVPWAVASGRVSSRSFGRMRRLRSVVRPLLSTVAAVAARTALDAERFAALGAPAEAIRVTGDLKEDREVPAWVPPPAGGPRWIAACTRPGEEDAVLDVLDRLAPQVAGGELILAPRHPERFEEVAARLADRGVASRRWAARDELPAREGWSVLLVDEMGVLDEAYRRAAVAFVGGSLSPFRGHSPLEAAAAGRPIVMGPHTENCRDAVERLTAVGALETVRSVEELATVVARHFAAVADSEAQGRIARDVVAASSGAAKRTVAHLRARGVL